MNEALPVLFAIGITILFVAFAVLTALVQRRRMTEGFRTLAQRTGLQVQEGDLLHAPQVTGAYQGRELRIYTYKVSSGKNSTTYTAVTMQIANPDHYTLMLRRETALDGLGKKLGMKDLSVGDDEFDRQFVVKSQPELLAPEMIRRNGNLRDAITRVPRIHIDLKDSTLRHHERGAQSNPDVLVSILDVLAGIAKAIEESRGVTETADVFDAPDEFASDAALDPALADDPFYRKTPEPEPVYPYDPVRATGPTSGIPLVTLMVLLVGIVMLGVAVLAFLLVR